MPRVNPEDTIVMEEMEKNPERLYANLRKLALIVLHCHYSFIRDESTQEDLISEAVSKAWELLASGTFDPKRSSIRNYCYSGMRNQMQNYVYKSTRSIAVPEVFDTLESCKSRDEESDIPYNAYVDEDLLYLVCDKYYRLGCYHNSVIKYLFHLGIDGEMTDLEFPDKEDPIILNACINEYIWRSKYGNQY